MKSRVGWVDIARGIGIIAVLYGHAISGDSYRHILYAFHMPLFFFLSGVVFRPQKNLEFFPFLKKNVVTILLPYLLFALLSYLIWLFARTNFPSIETIAQHTGNVIYGNSSGLFFNVVLWFLPCLFVTKLLFWIISKISLKPIFLVLTLLVLSIVAYSISILFPGIKLPLGAETALTATVFYGLGYLWNMYGEKYAQLLKKHAYLGISIFTLSLFVLASLNFEIYGYQIDMRLNRYSNFFLFYCAALSGILATLAISLKIDKNRILEYIGKQSLQLFVWHIIVFTYLTQFTRLFISPELFGEWRNLYIAPLFTLCAILIILSVLRLYQTLHFLIYQLPLVLLRVFQRFQ